jgi:hypothetical protein
MKNTFLLLFLMVSIIPVFSQQAKQLQFREETHDFGTVSENKGPVKHEFTFINNSTRPVKILSVQPSCGCTTPDWSKDPVAPGKTGYVHASFDPKGRPGFFNKSLTVTTDLEASPIILQIKGQVSGENEKADETGFTASNGNLKLKMSSFNLGKVFIKDEYAVREFPVINGGEKPMTFTGNVVAPKHIKIDVQPKTLAPGAKGTVKISYNGKIKNMYGFQSDNVEITTDDEAEPVKSFSVLATLEDYFPQMTAQELDKAPQLKLNDTNLDFGRLNASSQIVREVPFSNSGKKELTIKALQPNCSCVNVSAGKMTLKPGESTNLKITFSPDRKGSQKKAVTLYSNDPKNPVQMFTFDAYVE